MKREADRLLTAMNDLATNAEDESVNIDRALKQMQLYNSVLRAAFLVARYDRANKELVKNVILDSNH